MSDEGGVVTLAVTLSFDEAMWVRHTLGSLLETQRPMLLSLCGTDDGAVRSDWLALGEGALGKLVDATSRLLASSEFGRGPRSLAEKADKS